VDAGLEAAAGVQVAQEAGGDAAGGAGGDPQAFGYGLVRVAAGQQAQGFVLLAGQ